MTKRDLIAELARTRGLRTSEARAVVEAFLRSIERALTEGEAVTLRGFGRFEVRSRVGRTVRTPDGAHEVELPARLIPVFRGAPGLGERLSTLAERRTRPGTAVGRQRGQFDQARRRGPAR